MLFQSYLLRENENDIRIYCVSHILTPEINFIGLSFLLCRESVLPEARSLQSFSSLKNSKNQAHAFNDGVMKRCDSKEFDLVVLNRVSLERCRCEIFPETRNLELK